MLALYFLGETSKVFRLVKTSKVFARKHRRCFREYLLAIGVHMAEDEHAMSVAIVLKSPRVGGKFEVG